MKMNPNQFATITSKYPFETEEKIYSDAERDRFKEEAENWRMVRFYGELGKFNGDYAELFRTARLRPCNVIPLDPDDFLIENGKFVGVKVTCGDFDINGGMGGWRGRVVPLYFDQYEEIVKNREKYSFSEYTRYSSIHYCSAILPISILESLPAFIIEGKTLVSYWGKDSDVVIPDGVVEIGFQAFYTCDFIKNVTFPKSLKIIGTSSFKQTGLKQIVTSVKIEKVEEEAFSYCRDLEKTIFPDYTHIADSAFDCTPIEKEKTVTGDDDDDYEVISPEDYYRYTN